MSKRRKKLRFISASAMMAAILALLSPWTLPLGALPCTLATFALFLVAAVSPVGVACSATAVYLALGALGLPVFSSFAGGVGVFVSATGGFLWGYLPAALIVSLVAQKAKDCVVLLFLAMLAATLVIYTTGTLWFSVVSNASLEEALLSSVVPFLLPDALKIVAACFVGTLLKRRFAGFF